MAGMHVENGDVFPMIESFLRVLSYVGVVAPGEQGASRLHEPPLKVPDRSGPLGGVSTVSREACGTRRSPGVDFANMFTHSFYMCRSQKHKITYGLTVIFALLGTVHKKLLVKL